MQLANTIPFKSKLWQRSRWRAKELFIYIYRFAFDKACPYLPALITIVQNSWQWQQPNLPKQVWVGPIVCLIHEGKMVRNLFLNYQFGNNTFHLQIGRRNKTGLTYQIWEQCVPFKDSNSEQNCPECLIVKQSVPLTDRKSKQNTRKFRDKWPTSLRTSCSIQRCIFDR